MHNPTFSRPPFYGGIPQPPVIAPGNDCPTCHRRVPHPKKPSSPESEVFSTRMPLGEKKTFNEMIDAAAKSHGLHDKPHHKYWTLLHGLVLLLQEPSHGAEG